MILDPILQVHQIIRRHNKTMRMMSRPQHQEVRNLRLQIRNLIEKMQSRKYVPSIYSYKNIWLKLICNIKSGFIKFRKKRIENVSAYKYFTILTAKALLFFQLPWRQLTNALWNRILKLFYFHTNTISLSAISFHLNFFHLYHYKGRT